jgi:NitT/TauT family transport system permease protein
MKRLHARTVHYYSHRGHRKHLISPLQHISTVVLLPLVLIIIAVLVTTSLPLLPVTFDALFLNLLGALGSSLIRLVTAFVLALLLGIPLALLAEQNRHVESILLPMYDVLESIPVLAFFPVIILFFVRSGFLEGAAIFMLFFSMIWSIVFSAIGGLRVIPKDVKAVGFVFGFSRWDRLTKITLPALFPPVVTGSILSLAAGWNIVIVAEALHAYAPQTANAHDLYGIGSILVNAATRGDTPLLLSAMTLLVIVIAVVNLSIWQPLLARAEQYKFE